MRYLLATTIDARQKSIEDFTLQELQRVVSWPRRKGLRTVTPRFLQANGPRPRLAKSDEAESILTLLEEHRCVRFLCDRLLNKVYAVHPEICSQRSRCSQGSTIR